jgi:porphobilinogen synthase
LFVRSGNDVRVAVESMAGVCQTSVDEMLNDARDAASLGVGGVLLFGIPDRKDATGSEAWNTDGPVQQAVRALKRDVPELVVITDVCMCEYTDHGHCGIIRDGDVDNDATLEVLALEAVSHAQAGADIVAPSDMMDGRVGKIRRALDEAGYGSSPGRFTVHFATRRNPRRNSAIDAAIKWTRRTRTKPCARRSSTSRKARIS